MLKANIYFQTICKLTSVLFALSNVLKNSNIPNFLVFIFMLWLRAFRIFKGNNKNRNSKFILQLI